MQLSHWNSSRKTPQAGLAVLLSGYSSADVSGFAAVHNNMNLALDLTILLFAGGEREGLFDSDRSGSVTVS